MDAIRAQEEKSARAYNSNTIPQALPAGADENFPNFLASAKASLFRREVVIMIIIIVGSYGSFKEFSMRLR